MKKHKITMTQNDHNRLQEMLDTGIARTVGSFEYLDDLASELGRADIVPPEDVPRNVITMNSRVTLCDLATKERETYTLVFPESADIANNRLSVLAPVGTAVLGQRVGDIIRWRVPGGWRRLKVERILSQPEREGMFQV